MKRFLILLASLFFLNTYLHNDEVVQHSLLFDKKDPVSLVFVGDIMGHSPQFQAAYNQETQTYNYDICFNYLKQYIKNADFAIANLEVPLAGEPYSGYPNFSSPDELLDAVKNCGFDIILTANNHALDRGKFGLERTISQIENRKLLHLGSYCNVNQRGSSYPLIVKSKGIKIALLNCTYGTNGVRASKPDLVNYIDTTEILADIQKANKLGADVRIMTIHWGIENELKANKTQKVLAQFFVNHGIDLIVGSHPHVVQDAEILYNKDGVPVPVFYSLGNCISNQRDLNKNGGLLLRVEFDANSKKISNASYLPVYVYKGDLNGNYQYHLIPTTNFIKNPASFFINKSDSISLTEFYKMTCKKLYNFKLAL